MGNKEKMKGRLGIGVRTNEIRYRADPALYMRTRVANKNQTRNYTTCNLAERCVFYDKNSTICRDTPDLCDKRKLILKDLLTGGGFTRLK